LSYKVNNSFITRNDCTIFVNIMENQQDYKIKQYFFLGIILIFAYFLLDSLTQFFSAFLIAVIFYVLSKPMVEWLVKKKRWKKSWAAMLVIVLSFFIILLPITLFFTLLYNKIIVVLAHPDTILAGIRKFNASINTKYHIEILSDKTINSVQSNVAVVLPLILNQGVGFITTITMMYFFLYFMLQKMNRMEAGIVFYLPFKRDKINMFGSELVAQTFSNAVGIPLIATVQGICAFIAYTIIGVPQAGFWGVITAFSSLIPVIGSAIVWIPMTVYLFFIGENWQGVFMIIWSAVIISAIDNVLRFMLAKRMADVHPVVTVLGVIVGLKYFGFIGLFFGPVLISYFLILLQIYYVEYHQNAVKKIVKPEKKRQLMPSYMQPFLGKKSSKVNGR